MKLAFAAGTSRSAAAHALRMKSLIDDFSPSFESASLICFRAARMGSASKSMVR